MEIRRYNPGEEGALWEVVFQATRVSNARDYHPDLIERWAPENKDTEQWRTRLEGKNPFVAVIDGVVVGLAELMNDGFSDYFYVHPEYQGRGVGKALLSRIEEEAHRLGIDRLYANASVTAEPFFSSRGFEVTKAMSKLILGHPAPNFAMVKKLESSGLRFRRAVAEDAAEIYRVRRKAIEHGCRSCYPEEDVAAWAAAPMPEGFGDVITENAFFVAERAARIVGCGFLDREEGQVEAIFVDPECQRCGVGARLLVMLEETAREAGLGRLWLSATLNAVSFYKNAGFTPRKRTKYYSPAGVILDCVLMEKELLSSAES